MPQGLPACRVHVKRVRLPQACGEVRTATGSAQILSAKPDWSEVTVKFDMEEQPSDGAYDHLGLMNLRGTVAFELCPRPWLD